MPPKPLGYSPSNTPANADLDVLASLVNNAAGVLAMASSLNMPDALVVRDAQGRFQAGQVAFNMGYDTDRLVSIGGTFAGAVEAHALGVAATLIPAAGASAHAVSSEPTFQKAGSGAHAVFSSAWFRTPVILAGAATIGTVTCLYVTGPPSGGQNNYTVFVEGGVLRVGGVPGSAIVVGWQTAPLTSLTVGVPAGTSLTGPDGLSVMGQGNAIGQTAGVYFTFHGENISSAGITAIQQDTADFSGDLAVVTRSVGGGGSTAVRWRFKAAGHLVAEADNTYDIGSAAATRPRRVYVGTQVVTPAIVLTDATALITNSTAANAGRSVFASDAGGSTSNGAVLQVVGNAFGSSINGFIILDAGNVAGSRVSIRRNAGLVAEFGTGIGFFGTSMSAQTGAIANPAGGGTVDAEARTAIIAWLVGARNYGLVAP